MFQRKSLIHVAERCAHARVQNELARVEDKRIVIGKKASIPVPRKKRWSRTAVLACLSKATPMDPCTNAFYPQISLDLAPTMLNQFSSLDKVISHAKSTVEFMKEKDPDLFKIDWNTESEMKVQAPQAVLISSSPELSDPQSKEQSPADVLDNLMETKQLTVLQKTFQDLVEKEEITDEIKEKVLAFACFNAIDSDGLELLSSVLISTPPSNASMYNAVLRGFTVAKKLKDVEIWYGNMRKAGFFPDIITINKILGYRHSHSHSGDFLRNLILHVAKSRMRPSAETIVHAERVLRSKKNIGSEQILFELARCLSEIDQCTSESKADSLVTLLGLVCHKASDTSAAFAILELIDKTPCSTVRNDSGFQRAMAKAIKMRHHVLAEGIFYTACRLHVTLHQRLYLQCLEVVGLNSSEKKFMEMTSKMVGPLLDLHLGTYECLVKICSRRSWTQLLPFVFSIFDGVLLRPAAHVSFMKAAVQLSDTAEPETRLQLKNVATVLLSLTGSSRDPVQKDFISLLCTMFARYGDEEDLVGMLASHENFIRNLDQASREECMRIIVPDTSSSHTSEISRILTELKKCYGP